MPPPQAFCRVIALSTRLGQTCLTLMPARVYFYKTDLDVFLPSSFATSCPAVVCCFFKCTNSYVCALLETCPTRPQRKKNSFARWSERPTSPRRWRPGFCQISASHVNANHSAALSGFHLYPCSMKLLRAGRNVLAFTKRVDGNAHTRGPTGRHAT